MTTYIEHGGDKRAVTIVGRNAVYYSVEIRTDDFGWVTEWETRVDFARDKAHRPAGYAFTAAAAEQERRLFEEAE